MLIAAFQIHICRPCQFGPGFADCCMGRTAVEPDIHDIRFFAEMSAAAFGAFGALRQDLLSRMSPPGIRAFFSKQVGNSIDSIVVDQVFVAVFTVEDRDRYAPDTLTGNAPVVTVGDHIMDTCFAPGRDPLHVIAKQAVQPGQIFDDGYVGIKNEHACKIRTGFCCQFT